jgi:riboflavin-specific deaminase-like protein
MMIGEEKRVGGIYEDVELRHHTESGETATRPYVFINMVTSVDGKASVDGKVAGLGTDVDRSVMRTLRSKADAVMIGGGTLRAEKLSLGLDSDDPRRRPLAVILTNTGELPLESNLVRDNQQDLLIMLSEGADEHAELHLGRLANVRRVPVSGSGLVDLARSLTILRSDYNVGSLLIEGGPTLNRALISAELADELFITLSPMLIGESGTRTPGIIDGVIGEPRNLRILSAHLTGNEMFLRYALKATSETSG